MDVMNAALGQILSTSAPEAVNLITARNQFQASAQMFQAGDKMQKKLLDMMA